MSFHQPANAAAPAAWRACLLTVFSFPPLHCSDFGFANSDNIGRPTPASILWPSWCSCCHPSLLPIVPDLGLNLGSLLEMQTKKKAQLLAIPANQKAAYLARKLVALQTDLDLPPVR